MPGKTRTKILEYLRKTPIATAEELGRGLGMTPANIRHHLALMLKEDSIHLVDLRKDNRGRPTKVFGATNRVLGDGVGRLAEALMDALNAGPNQFDLEPFMKATAEQLVESAPIGPLGNKANKLTATIDRLNTLHYQARWEAGPTGARIILGHCPYAEIIDRHPELCRMDAHLLEGQSGAQARQLAKLKRGKDGLFRCIFAIE